MSAISELFWTVLIAAVYFIAVIIGGALLISDPTSVYVILPIVAGIVIIVHAGWTDQLRTVGYVIMGFLFIDLIALALVTVIEQGGNGIPIGSQMLDMGISIALATALVGGYVTLTRRLSDNHTFIS